MSDTKLYDLLGVAKTASDGEIKKVSMLMTGFQFHDSPLIMIYDR